MNYNFTAVRIEDDSEAADWGFGHFASKGDGVLFEARDFGIQIRYFKSQDCTTDWDRMFRVGGADREGGVPDVVFEPLTTGFVRELQAENVFVEVTCCGDVADGISHKGNGMDHGKTGGLRDEK